MQLCHCTAVLQNTPSIRPSKLPRGKISETVSMPRTLGAWPRDRVHDDGLIRQHPLGTSRGTIVGIRIVRLTGGTVRPVTVDPLLSCDGSVAAGEFG